MTPLEAALAHISADRAAAFTFDLVAIPSPTGETVEVSERFAAELWALGLEVEDYRKLPRTPVIVGRRRGEGGGPTLVLNGHLDTVPIPHSPAERRDGRIYGRGSIDMKGPLAAGIEAIRASVEAGLRFRGDIVICAHGLHEAPGGHAEDLIAALQDGVVTGDAAIVLEIGHNSLPLAGLGSGIYQAHFRRPDPVTHELMTPAGTPNPVFAAAEALLALREENERLKRKPWELAGPESVFVGQVHSGDFFNRFSNHAWIEGTRRYSPEMTAADAAGELRALLQPIAERHGVELDLRFERVRDGFRTPADHPLVEAAQTAYVEENGTEMPVVGIKIVADAPVFDKVGGIPCIYHGIQGDTAHSDLEYVEESELERGARFYLRTMAHYLGLA